MAASLAGAFTGLADNSSAIYYNPAGIAFQKGVGFRLNVTYSKYKVTAESKEEQIVGLYDSVNEQLQGFFLSPGMCLTDSALASAHFHPIRRNALATQLARRATQ